MKIKGLLTIFLSVFIISTSWAYERPGIHPLLSDDFSGSLGLFFTNIDSEIGIDGRKKVDLEDDLGFDDQTDVFFGTFKWRFTESFHVSLEYLEIDRGNQSFTLDNDVNWDDLHFSAGSNIKSDAKVSFARLFVGYSFMQSEQFELGAGLGVHLMDIDTKISGQATINGVFVSNAVRNKDTLAPLPNIGLFTAYAFSSKVIIKGRVDWLSADTGDYSGSLGSVVAEIQYQAFKNVGFGAGYHYLSTDIDIDTNSWSGNTNYTYYGPKIFMTINF